LSVAVPHVRRVVTGAHCPGERPKRGRARIQPAWSWRACSSRAGAGEDQPDL